MWLTLLLRYWKPLAVILALAFAVWWIYDAGKESAEQKAELAAYKAELEATQDDLRKAEAAAQAAQAARNRNDTEIPRIRSDTQGRADRAATADAATRLSDVQAALDSYASAAGSVRGKGAR